MVRLVDAEASADGLLALYDEQVGAVYAFVLRRCGEGELAEDLTQETFLEAARRFRDTAEIAAPSWLFQVARNRLIDHWRREARMRRKVRLLSAASPDQRGEDPANVVTTGLRVMAALDGLPADHRMALLLRYLDDYSVGEVAQMMGRSPKATESLLARARRNFESKYEEHDGG